MSLALTCSALAPLHSPSLSQRISRISSGSDSRKQAANNMSGSLRSSSSRKAHLLYLKTTRDRLKTFYIDPKGHVKKALLSAIRFWMMCKSIFNTPADWTMLFHACFSRCTLGGKSWFLLRSVMLIYYTPMSTVESRLVPDAELASRLSFKRDSAIWSYLSANEVATTWSFVTDMKKSDGFLYMGHLRTVHGLERLLNGATTLQVESTLETKIDYKPFACNSTKQRYTDINNHQSWLVRDSCMIFNTGLSSITAFRLDITHM